jgi:hypothetical protein
MMESSRKLPVLYQMMLQSHVWPTAQDTEITGLPELHTERFAQD